MPLETTELIERLARFPAALRAAASCFSADETRWKPAPQHWSVLEIVSHVADEEHEDFAPRLRATLEGRAWEPLDFDAVAERRGYNTRDLDTELARFASARADNVRWLRTLIETRPDFSIAYQHPQLGPIAAGDLLTSWSAHDALHLRQIAKRLHNLASRDAEASGFAVTYAGDWTA
jgi:hypothetical protein